MATTYSGYAIYTYNDPDYPAGTGMAGVITDNGGTLSPPPTTPTLVVTADMKDNLNADPKVEPFIDTASTTTSPLRVVATDRAGGASNVAYIYDPVDVVNASTTPVPPVSTETWTNQNLYTVVRLGDFLYTIDYDRGMVFEVQGTSPYAELTTTTPYTFTPPAGFQGCGQALIVVGTTLYALFSCPNSNWTQYVNSRLVRLTIGINPVTQQKEITAAANDINANIEMNAFAIASDGTNFYITSIGGAQGSSGQGNPASKLQSISTSFNDTTAAIPVLVPTDLPATSPAKSLEFRDVSIDNSGNFYIFVGTYNANWNMDGFIYRAPLAAPKRLTQFAAVVDIAGYYWSAQYTSNNDRVWFARGNDVYVIDAANFSTNIGVLTMSDLIGGSKVPYDSLNDLCVIGAYTAPGEKHVRLSGYKSHWQRSNSKLARAVRALTKGRPEPTEEEIAQAQASLA